MTTGELGKVLMALGGILLIAGAAMTLGGKLPWLGRLPGDIAIEREHFRFYFPLATSIVISILLTLFVWIIRR
jgi:membrane protein implicated in regulation of membrane protease activity